MSQETKHTPGPWEIDPLNTNGCISYYIRKTQGAEDLYESMANARLIAAAPELLEACREMLRISSHSSYVKCFDGADTVLARQLANVRRQIGDAIIKATATGESA